MVDVFNPTNRIPSVGNIPTVTSGVTITQTTHELTYVDSIQNIGPTPQSKQTVDAWELSNGLVSAKTILKGGNLVSIKLKGNEYVWINSEGATYYGAKSGGNESPFPLTRGLILHGGIRLTAVTAEHGLYYDTPWDISFETDANSSSIILSITDDEATRISVNDPFTSASYSLPEDPRPLSKYPVTNALFRFKITLVNGESYVRLHGELVKSSADAIKAEIWLPQTYQITTESQIISSQVKRRCKDVWVRDVLFPNPNVDIIPLSDDPDRLLEPYQELLTEPNSTPFVDQRVLTKFPPQGYELDYPLKWESGSGGILYDYPYRDGNYHAVSFGDGTGRGVAAVGSSTINHFTKLWSWGDPKLFDREALLQQVAEGNFGASLASGRPYAEYYEPWDTAYNTGFFERHTFTNLINGWDTFIVPIESGLDIGKTQAELRQVVENVISSI